MRPYLSYAYGLLFILIWWFWAFTPFSPSPSYHLPTSDFILNKESSQDHFLLLKQAFNGDAEAMDYLSKEMEMQAWALKTYFPQDSLSLIRHCKAVRKELRYLGKESQANFTGVCQSYSSALLLLSLAKPEQLLSLPQGLRNYQDYLPGKDLNKIFYDTESLEAKDIVSYNPNWVIAASYSHPRALSKYRKTPIFFLKDSHTLNDIQCNLCSLGLLTQQSTQALAMASFMGLCEAFLKLKFQSLRLHAPKKPFESLLFLQYYHHFSLAARSSLNYHMLSNLSLDKLQKQLLSPRPSWSEKISKAKILSHNPHTLVLITSYGPQLLQALKQDPLLSQVEAVKNNRCLVLDEFCSNSPSPLILLNFFTLLDFFESQYSPTVSL